MAPTASRDDVAARALADIWSSPKPTDEAEPEAAEGSRVVGERLARADIAQRALADIWRPRVAGVVEPVAVADAVEDALAERQAAIAVHPEQPSLLEPPLSTERRLALALDHIEARRFAEALPLLEAVVVTLDGSDSAAGDSRLRAARVSLAETYLATRRPAPAIALYELLLDEPVEVAVDGEHAVMRLQRARAYRASGMAGAAIDQLSELVAELDGIGVDERLIDAVVELATTYVIAHRIPEGIATYEAALPRAQGLLGSGHRTSLSIRMLLARAYLQDGRTALAIRTYRDVTAAAEHALGINDRLARQAGSELSGVLRNQRR